MKIETPGRFGGAPSYTAHAAQGFLILVQGGTA
jgi:hypothetical protein